MSVGHKCMDSNWTVLYFAGWSHHNILLFTIHRDCCETRDPLQSVSGIFPRQPSTGFDHSPMNIRWLHAVRWLADHICRPTRAGNYILSTPVLLYLVLVLVLKLYLSTFFGYWYWYLYFPAKYLYWYLNL